MKIFTQLKFIVFSLAVIAAVSSCRKFSDDDGSTPDTEVPGTDDGSTNQNQVVITFPRTVIDINTTDSLVAVFNNGTRTIRKRAAKGGTFYTLSLNGVPTGTWSTNIKVYTSASKMYRYETSLNTGVSQTLVGPTGKLTDNWKTNLFVRDASYGITFAVAAIPSDPYYEISLPNTLVGYTHVYMDRYAYKVIDSTEFVVAYNVQTLKAADHKGFQANTSSFAAFATAMKDQPWDTADVSLQLYNESGSSTKYRVVFEATVKNE